MNLLGTPPADEILEPLERIYRQALVRGAPRPYGVVVEDGAGDWKFTLARLSLDSRRAVVVAARAAGALGLAARWSVGGALLLPPSTAAMTAGLGAVRRAGSRPSWIADPVMIRDFADDPQMVRVTLIPPGAWRALCGERGMVECLVALAELLSCEPLIDEGPSVLLPGAREPEIRRAWLEVGHRPVWAGDEALLVAAASHKPSGSDCRSLARRSWPVAELPSGKNVGRFVLTQEVLEPTHDMTLVFETGAGWTIDLGEGERHAVPEVCDPCELADVETGLARVPGWLTLDLDCEGSPAAVLVKTLSLEAGRRGIVLWVPGVTAKSLPFVMRLQGRIWVDGPAVPETGS